MRPHFDLREQAEGYHLTCTTPGELPPSRESEFFTAAANSIRKTLGLQLREIASDLFVVPLLQRESPLLTGTLASLRLQGTSRKFRKPLFLK